jgi:hypothetical protein
MPSVLDARDIRLLIGAVAVMVLLLGLTYAISPPPAQQSIGFPSSYSTEWAGAKAAFLLLQNLGYDAERWDESPENLPPESAGTVLVLAEPLEGGSASERAAIRRFVTNGGRVLAIGSSAAQLVPDAAATDAPEWDPRALTYPALVPSPLTRDAPEITMVSPDIWTSTDSSRLWVYGDDDKPVVVSYRVGLGEVIWWASASPLSNGSIRDKGNLALFLNSIGPSSSSTVLWDEYYHGARGSLLSYFAKTPLPWAGLQIGIALLAVLFTFSRRSGAVYVPVGESRLSPLEFVETLGDLYRSAHASPAAVAVAYRRFRFALSRKLAAPANVKLPELCHAAAGRFGWPESSLLDTLARSERAMRSINPDEREALYLVRQLHEYSASLEPQGGAEQETPAWR